MSFEDDLRSTLRSQAGDLDLHGRGAREVMHLARHRQHRARRAGAVAAVGVLGVGVVGAMAARRTDGVAVTSVADGVGLPDIGPLELSWQTTPGGVTGGTQGEVRFTDDGGALYALSTAPGARLSADVLALVPVLYRLAEDGSWVPAADGASVPMVDVAADGDTLYAIGTAPGQAGFDAVLSSSADGGASWVPASTTPVAPPSTTVAWDSLRTLAVERAPGATMAIVSTMFSPEWQVFERAMAAAGVLVGADHGYMPEVSDDGYDVVVYGAPSALPSTGAPTTLAPDGATEGTVVAAPPAAAPATSIALDGSPVDVDVEDPARRAKGEPTRSVIATISWAELGITGPGDLATTQVLVERDGAWTPVTSPALAGISINRVTTAGQQLVLEGWDRDGSSHTFASADGVTWRPIAVGQDSRISGLGSAWIDVPWTSGDGSPVVRSSVDQGASWATVDLAAVDGRLAGTGIVSVDSGPLGLAAVAIDYSDGGVLGRPAYLVTTRDLHNWTVTPLADIAGATSANAVVHVGADRIVVTASEGFNEDGLALPASITAIGTPVR